MSPEVKDSDVAPRRYGEYVYEVGEVAWIVAIFFLFGSGASPEINEPHYLIRAKNYWDPTFCARDFFLSSQDAHAVFFALFGWITRWLSLPAAAWCGRFVGWTLLAAAWYRLSSSVTPRRGLSLLTATIWVTLVQRCHMSGEWITGGVEGKVVAYALVIWGLSYWVQGRYVWTWILEGAAASFHVLVGGWAVMMTFFAAATSPVEERGGYLRSWPGLVLGAACSLAGILPAMQLYADVAPNVAQQAAEIYVFHRLPHHLLISEFNPLFVLRHVALIVVFAILWNPARRDVRFARIGRVVWGAVVLAIVGVVMEIATADSTWAARAMRYYWYRASDIFVPLGVALAIGLLWLRYASKRPRPAFVVLVSIVALLAGNLLMTVNDLHFRAVPAADRQGGLRDRIQLSDWQDVGSWVRTHLPQDALCLTPSDHQTFKWYAHRAELVTWKDVPQDASSIVDWSNRLTRVRSWRQSESSEDAERQLRDIVQDYGVDYLIVRRPSNAFLPPWPVLYQNPHYVVLEAAPTARAP